MTTPNLDASSRASALMIDVSLLIKEYRARRSGPISRTDILQYVNSNLGEVHKPGLVETIVDYYLLGDKLMTNACLPLPPQPGESHLLELGLGEVVVEEARVSVKRMWEKLAKNPGFVRDFPVMDGLSTLLTSEAPDHTIVIDSISQPPVGLKGLDAMLGKPSGLGLDKSAVAITTDADVVRKHWSGPDPSEIDFRDLYPHVMEMPFKRREDTEHDFPKHLSSKEKTLRNKKRDMAKSSRKRNRRK